MVVVAQGVGGGVNMLQAFRINLPPTSTGKEMQQTSLRNDEVM